MCGNLSYTLTYEGGASVQTGDTLYAKETNTMKVTLTYDDTVTASELPTFEVSISNLNITIDYQQSSDALVKDNGEVANNKVYHLGEKITINSADYYVMEDSGAGQDYIVSGVDGGMAYYTSETCGYVNDTLVISGCTTDYNLSDIKYVIDNWSNAVFQNEELKAVNGNKARLITIEEASRFGCSPNTAYSCKTPVYSDILKAYWTMTANPTSIFSMYSIYHQYSSWDSKVYSSSFAARVRPVINVYKSAIQ